MIKSPHYSWKLKTGFGIRVPGFKVIWLKLDVPLSLWISWLFTMKVFELTKTWWEEFRAMDDSGIFLLSNTSTSFANTFLSHVEICNNWLESCCIIVDGRQTNKMTRALNWRSQCNFGSNNLYKTIEFMNIYPFVDSQFYAVVKECDEICHLGRNVWFDFFALWKFLHKLEEKSFRRYSFYREDNFLLKSDNSAMKLSKLLSFIEQQDMSDWTPQLILRRLGTRECRILDIIIHPDISWSWVMTTL